MTESVGLTCAQIPLAWPSSVAITDVKPCSTCGFQLSAPESGSLQLSARSDRNGINIKESSNIAVDYQGQRYSLDVNDSMGVFHTPGLHVFPDQSDVFPAEYHITLTSVSLPTRTIVLVVPLSHRSQDDGVPAGADYFAAASSNPNTTGLAPPPLSTLFVPGSPVLQYYAGDLFNCDPRQPDIQYLLVLRVMSIRATDLERIPREGTGSTLPDALPLPGPKPSQAVPRDLLLRSTLLAMPGIVSSSATHQPPAQRDLDPTAYTCKPIQVMDGKDVLVNTFPGTPLPQILDISGASCAPPPADGETGGSPWIYSIITFLATMAGLLLADMLFGYVWGWFFSGPSDRLEAWLPIKIFFFLIISIGSIFWPHATRDATYSAMNYFF